MPDEHTWESGMYTIRFLRRVRGISPEDLARQVGVTPAVIARWEQGDGQPTAPQAQRLAGVFGVAARELAAERHDERR